MRELIQVSRDVNQSYPQLLQRNHVKDVFTFITLIKRELEQEGHRVSFIGKTRGEGQYTPEGFGERAINGHWITGVSHDAMWVDGKQYDFVGSGNDSDADIFDSTGNKIVASPAANEIDPKWWRPNNPPVEFGPKEAPLPAKPPVVQPSSGVKDQETFFREIKELNDFYKSNDGLKRYGGMVIGEQADVEAMGQWCYKLMIGKTIEDCKNEIRQSFEWRAKH